MCVVLNDVDHVKRKLVELDEDSETKLEVPVQEVLNYLTSTINRMLCIICFRVMKIMSFAEFLDQLLFCSYFARYHYSTERPTIGHKNYKRTFKTSVRLFRQSNAYFC
jgi:hypothetical protein